MNPYLLGGIAVVAFFLLRGRSQPAGAIQPALGGGGDGATRTVTGEESLSDVQGRQVTAARVTTSGGTVAQPTIDDPEATARAIARLRELDEQRRREVGERLVAQTQTVQSMTVSALKNAPVASPYRSMTDFGA